jgi:Txe/YoeB family toxin of Txe-Axe toxin-antitoxin module
MIKLRTHWRSEADRKRFKEAKQDKDLFKKLTSLYKDICRDPTGGIGRHHALTGNRSGWYSRHITGACVIVYRVDLKQRILYIKRV